MSAPPKVDGTDGSSVADDAVMPDTPEGMLEGQELAQSESEADDEVYVASFFPGEHVPVPQDFAEAVLALQGTMGRPVWVMVHGHHSPQPFNEINEGVRRAFFAERAELRACSTGAVLLIDSPGGIARSAFQIASLFRRHSGGLTVVVPRMAKSAATLLTLGAERIYMGHDAELGPLDAQIWDSDREEYSSALDEVQALERLNSVALDFVDQAMFLLINRTGKKVDSILPPVLHFAAEFMKPLLDKIDTVHYTQWSRALKVAEDYATRLLQPQYNEAKAKEIARDLVNSYAEHEFSIYREELGEMLESTLAKADKTTQSVIDDLERILTESRITALGRIERRANDTSGDSGS